MKSIIRKLIPILFIVTFSLAIYTYVDQTRQIQGSSSSVVESKISIESFVDYKLSSMTIEQKRGATFMVSIPGTTLYANTAKFLKENNIGGVILLQHNVESEVQLKKLTEDLRTKVNPNILIAIDQEGGSVVRITWDKYATISARDIGDKGDLDYAYKVASYRATLLRDLGINVMLGPVADVSTKTSDFTYSRTFSSNPEKAANYIETTVRANKEAGVISVLKHFPGHGQTNTDSHENFPVINKSVEKLKSREFIPFQKGIEAGAEMIMVGHIMNPQIDPKNPSSKSIKYIEILENDLGFDGTTITDDLTMTGQIQGGIDWGINLSIESQSKILQRISTTNPQEKYIKKLLILIYSSS